MVKVDSRPQIEMPAAGVTISRLLRQGARRHCQSPHSAGRTSPRLPSTGICNANCTYSPRLAASSLQWRSYSTEGKDNKPSDNRKPPSSQELPQHQTSKSSAGDAASKPSSSLSPKDDQAYDEELPSFKAQIWESTEGRIKREREEQERFARHRAEKRQYVGAVTAGGMAFLLLPFNDRSCAW